MTLKREKNEHGASTFEMAFILPLIILPLIFGALDFSRAMYAYHFVAYAAREASRWASVRGSTCAAQVVMQDCGAAASGSTLVETAFFGFGFSLRHSLKHWENGRWGYGLHE
jgi:Flp pilus assembly protein TadG